jgi:hypothetical protein
MVENLNFPRHGSGESGTHKTHNQNPDPDRQHDGPENFPDHFLNANVRHADSYRAQSGFSDEHRHGEIVDEFAPSGKQLNVVNLAFLNRIGLNEFDGKAAGEGVDKGLAGTVENERVGHILVGS